MTGTCLCGTVSVTIDAKPGLIHDCPCTLCRKSDGAWSYFTASRLLVEGATLCVMRTDKADPAAKAHRHSQAIRYRRQGYRLVEPTPSAG